MGRITINGTMSQFSCKLTVRSTLWDAKANKASGKSLEAQRLNEKLENILMIFLVISGFLMFKYRLDYPIINGLMGRGIANFFLGGCLYKLIMKVKNSQYLTLGALGVLILTLVALKFWPLLTNYIYYINALIIFPTIFIIVLNSKLLLKIMPNKFLKTLSKLSYSVYLNQILIMEFTYLINLKFKFINFYSPLFFISFMLILIIFSYGTYKLIEQKGKKLLLKE